MVIFSIMQKTDISIKNICVAAIKRSISNPMGFMYTWFYAEGYAANLPNAITNEMQLLNNELPIASTIFSNRWTLITTQRVLSCSNGTLMQVKINQIASRSYGLFKGSNVIKEVTGSIKDKQGNTIDFYMEAGAASLVMIKALNTLIAISH